MAFKVLITQEDDYYEGTNRSLTIEIGQSGVSAVEGVHLPVGTPAVEAAVGARAAVRIPPAREGCAGVVVHLARAGLAGITTSSRHRAVTGSELRTRRRAVIGPGGRPWGAEDDAAEVSVALAVTGAGGLSLSRCGVWVLRASFES